jgi:hypothetical protein
MRGPVHLFFWLLSRLAAGVAHQGGGVCREQGVNSWAGLYATKALLARLATMACSER